MNKTFTHGHILLKCDPYRSFKVNLIINKVVFHSILTFGIFCIIWVVVSVLISKLNPLANHSLKPVYNDVSNVVEIFE